MNYINKNLQENTIEITNEEKANEETSEESLKENNEKEIEDENNTEEANIITVDTSTTLENAKTKVKESLLKINNNKNNLINEFKEKIEKQYTNIEEQKEE